MDRTKVKDYKSLISSDRVLIVVPVVIYKAMRSFYIAFLSEELVMILFLKSSFECVSLIFTNAGKF